MRIRQRLLGFLGLSHLSVTGFMLVLFLSIVAALLVTFLVVRIIKTDYYPIFYEPKDYQREELIKRHPQ